jgi:hypothetical protein
MRTIATTAIIPATGLLTVQVPPEIAPGTYQVVLVIDESPQPRPEALARQDVPVWECGAWPADLPLRREDMYGDDGR